VADTNDQLAAYKQQKDSVLYTLDCVLLAPSEDVDATFVTFDAEVLENGGIAPSEFLPGGSRTVEE